MYANVAGGREEIYRKTYKLYQQWNEAERVERIRNFRDVYLTESTGQGASRITYWALEPNTSF